MKEDNEIKSFLFDKKVKIVPVFRDGVMITEKDHVGYYRFDDTKIGWVLPLSKSRRTLVPILTNDEKEFFEKTLDLDLNFYKKKDNFWHKFRVEIMINDDFKKNGVTLDLSDPMDNLKWRLWKTAIFMAPSWEERFDKGEYTMAMVDADYKEVQRSVKSAKNIKAYKHLGKIEGSHTKCYDFLMIYALQNPKAKHPDSEATTESLVAELQRLIDEDIDSYLAIAEDEHYDTKLLIHRAVAMEAITKKWNTKEYFTPEGKLLGTSLDQVVKNLKTEPDYQEDYLKIKAVVSATAKKEK